MLRRAISCEKLRHSAMLDSARGGRTRVPMPRRRSSRRSSTKPPERHPHGPPAHAETVRQRQLVGKQPAVLEFGLPDHLPQLALDLRVERHRAGGSHPADRFSGRGRGKRLHVSMSKQIACREARWQLQSWHARGSPPSRLQPRRRFAAKWRHPVAERDHRRAWLAVVRLRYRRDFRDDGRVAPDVFAQRQPARHHRVERAGRHDGRRVDRRSPGGLVGAAAAPVRC